MRRFHADHEGVLPHERVLTLWKCDEAATASTLADSSYSNLYPLVLKGPGAITAQIGLFNSGLEGTDYTQPVMTDLIHWHETAAQEPETFNGTDSYLDDLSGFTYEVGGTTYRAVWFFQLGAGQAVVDSAVLNGQDAIRWGNPSF